MPPKFDHEKLKVYQFELHFITWLTQLLAELKQSHPRGMTTIIDQLDRASLSVLLNTAEGNGRRATQQRIRFLDDARGSATECAACLDALVAKSLTSPPRIDSGKDLLISIVSMLTKLIELFEGKLDKPLPSKPLGSTDGE
ncbi:four helix bundle protein [Phragmitibacter flavus]|uniref:Four helix bundle protein n=1 Tax=Phragmitibacter flavus TaxID=2576071 RepID=A0A5R8KFU1_9BACT|nr:four helix bundle protein [Phragmitibacter flavus]TLD71163.1 four helix bundle protein [Phragmitibacter flavus]